MLIPATAADVVRRLTDTTYDATAESALAWGMGDVDPQSIRPALEEALAAGTVEVAEVRDTTYGRAVRFVRLASPGWQGDVFRCECGALVDEADVRVYAGVERCGDCTTLAEETS